MATLVRREQIDKVKAALASVQSNGQAAAACDAAVSAATKLASVLEGSTLAALSGPLAAIWTNTGPQRQQAAKDVREYVKRVEVERRKLDGGATLPVGATWTKAKEQIFNLYMLVFTVESTMGEGADLGDAWTDAVKASVAELPQNLQKAAKVAAQTVQTVVTETAKVGGSLVWGVFAGAWPLIIILGVVGVGYLVLRKKVPVLP